MVEFSCRTGWNSFGLHAVKEVFRHRRSFDATRHESDQCRVAGRTKAKTTRAHAKRSLLQSVGAESATEDALEEVLLLDVVGANGAAVP